MSKGLHRVHRAAALEMRAAACNKRRPPVLKDTMSKRKSFVKRVTEASEWSWWLERPSATTDFNERLPGTTREGKHLVEKHAGVSLFIIEHEPGTESRPREPGIRDAKPIL